MDLDIEAAVSLLVGASLMNAITLRVNANVDRDRLDRDLFAAVDLLAGGLAPGART